MICEVKVNNSTEKEKGINKPSFLKVKQKATAVKNKMENGKHVHHSMSMPLVSRLDHLESVMKDLESKQKLAKWGSNCNNSERQRQHLPLNLAMKEAYFKGSLLDRVASLETRLFQFESSTSIRTFGGLSLSQGSKKEPSCSLPTFSYNVDQGQIQEPCSQVLVNSSEIQGKYSKKVQQRRKQASPIKQRGKSKANKDEKTCKSGKKRVSSNWPHLKIFGC